MIATGLVSVTLVIVALALLLGRQGLTARDRLVKRRVRDVVVVTLKNGSAFRGVLHDADGRSFVLRDAEVVGDSTGRPVPVDGELVVARDLVEYFQKP